MENVQYSGIYATVRRRFSTEEDVQLCGDIISTVRRQHQYIQGRPFILTMVYRTMLSTVWDFISIFGDTISRSKVI